MLLFLASSLALFALTIGATASEFRYLLPGNIVMTLEETPRGPDKEALNLVATLRAKFGTPKNIEVYFESTPNFRVTPEKTSLAHLATEPLRAHLTVESVPGAAPADNESWIRMRVVYEPDYDRLAQLVSNEKRYPDPAERQRLIDRITKNAQTHARQTDAVRYFPPPIATGN
ncbi:MAG TPA: hypothetical protein PLP29_06680 [Candidatus Ozemobacteraceae bacterium]|nr:hypothetical protein [Candidatus Ozemobacteraceae bacterium]